ncbi:MAG TPA: hypothetical protein VFN81_08740 [Sphingomicrobium sp.]|nr:hypothetical protein [Sphingomicrobium sp.]
MSANMDNMEPVRKNIDEAFKALARVPAVWAHHHDDFESRKTYDARFVDVCETCEGRYEDAVLEGRACARHPGSLYEKAVGEHPEWCEECEIEAEHWLRLLKVEVLMEGKPPLTNPIEVLVRRAFLAGRRAS